jgi:hypothetical protein
VRQEAENIRDEKRRKGGGKVPVDIVSFLART